MRNTIGTAAAGAVLCVCALALAGCSGKGHAAGDPGAPGAGTPTTAPAVSPAAQPGADGVPAGTPTGAAAVDSELNSVDQQLGVAGTDLSKATVAPSDGG